MSRLVEIEAFVAVADHGSFVAAATALGVSSSYVSKLVSRLEERLRVRLLHRTTRQLTFTRQGERFLSDCREAFARLRRAEECVHDDEDALRGDIRLSAPTGLGLGALAELFHGFSLDHPDVRLSVSYLDRNVDLIAERFDLAVRVGELPDSSFHARRVGRYRKQLVASPGFVEEVGPIDHPEALEGRAGVVDTGEAHPTRWTLRHDDGQSVTLTVERRLASNNGRALARAVADGLGIGFLPAFHVCDLERSGHLVRLFPDWGRTVPVHVVFPTQRHLPNRIRALIDHLVEGLAREGMH